MSTLLTELANGCFYENKFARISYLPQQKVALCQAIAAYIPIHEFKTLFAQASLLIEKEGITKFIFDKSALTIFHQPSMEWYHIEWKEQVYRLGLSKHRKILPDDKVFEQSVITGKKLIRGKYPDFDFAKYDIQYCTTLEQALTS